MHPSAIGPYQILRELGRGGMGEVYLARDTRLDRQVAIKALPAHLAQDPDRLARFQREAKVLASLNHPGIGAIYGLEETDGHQYLILEFVEGETLAARLANGPIPVDEALIFARQIAEALEVAHEKGVVHRDLKPGNVMVTPDGVVKVLDFGLARSAEGALSSSNAFGANPASPTLTSPALVHSPTIPGAIMGTAGYMSPEQARGKSVDKRSDIFSFGCVLYEMLTGTQPFRGETVADAIGATLHKDIALGLLPAESPPTVRLLLAQCLTKDRANRLHDIADARLQLMQAISDPTGTSLGLSGMGSAPERRARHLRTAMLCAMAAVVLLGGTFPLWSGRIGLRGGGGFAAGPVVHFTITPPPGYTMPDFVDGQAAIAISPLGDRIAFTAEADGKSFLFMRNLADDRARLLPDTERCGSPFFSPDGKWLGYASPSRLMKMPVGGGPSLTVCEVNADGGTWLEDGTIIFSSGTGGLWRVIASGGDPVLLARAGQDVKTSDGTHLVLGFNTALAVQGADYVLATVWDSDTIESYSLVAVSLADGAVRSVLRKAADTRLIARDKLVFMRGSTALTVGFDPVRGVVVGEPAVALEQVRTNRWADTAYMAASTCGTMAYVPGGRSAQGRRLMRVDETGNATPLLDGTDAFVGVPIVSPDGKRAVVTTLRRKIELWLVDFERRSMSLLAAQGENWSPRWSADGASVFTLQVVPGQTGSIVRRSVGGGEPQVLPGTSGAEIFPNQALPDGSGLLVTKRVPGPISDEDILVYRFADESLTPLRKGPGRQRNCLLAPDGSWIAYDSNESGRTEVYIGPLLAAGPNVQVSVNGGNNPRISRDGKLVYFVDRQDAVMSATVGKTDADLRVSPPKKLFDLRSVGTPLAWDVFDVLPDGGFVVVEPAAWEKEPAVINVVLNWAEELRAKSAGK